MGISLLRATGRLFAPVVAVALLAGVSLEAGAYGSKGVIRLQLGNPGASNRFAFDHDNSASTADTPVQEFRTLRGGDKCLVQQDSVSGEPIWNGASLVSLKGFGPNGADPGQLGLGTDSLGVYDNSKGVSCYRMTGSIHEGIELSLGSYTRNTIGADAFDRLEIDLEVKDNAIFELKIFNDESLTPRIYKLYSGTNLYSGPGLALSESDRDHPHFNCGAASDSGPDSGERDNCKWVINDFGTSFELRPTSGEGSLEGGGDFADAYAANTKIFLTTLSDHGWLTCTPSPGKDVVDDPSSTLWDNQTAKVGGGPITSCQTTRIDPSNLPHVSGGSQSADCEIDFEYDLRTFLSGDSRCQLEKLNETTGNTVGQLAGSIQITFEPEPSAEWGAVDPTEVYFAGSDVPFYAPRCTGTVVPDRNGNLTIQEVLAGDWPYDHVSSTSEIEWACVLDNREIYLGDDLMRIVQTILYWGDISWSRGGSN